VETFVTAILICEGRLGYFPDDCLGGNNSAASGATIALHIGKELIQTDIDEGKAIFRERGAIRRPFEDEGIVEGDLILIERIEPRTYRVAKASKRGFAYYL
jgi:hypothetical protein